MSRQCGPGLSTAILLFVFATPKRYLELFAKYGGLIAVCAEWIGFVLFAVIRPDMLGGHNTVSHYGSATETHVIFSVCLTIAATSFWVFAKYHLPKFYKVPVRMFTASMLGYGALALFPFNPYEVANIVIHLVFVYFFAITFTLGIYLMGRNNKDANLHRVSYVAVILTLIFFILLTIAAFKQSSSIMAIEVAGIFILQAWTIWISLRSLKAATKD